MDLSTYLFTEKLMIKDLAASLMMNANYLSQIVRGEKEPSKRLAKDIENITQGKVQAKDLRKLAIQMEKHKKKQGV